MALLLTTDAHAESVFRVVVRQGGSVAASGLGVLVAEGFLLTGEGLIANGEEALVGDSGSGATVVAEIRKTDPEVDLALLSVPGLRAEAIPLALNPASPGRQIYLRGLEGARREGVFHSELMNVAQRSRYRFTAIAGEDEHAAPLLNNCNELLAISATRTTDEDETAEASFGESNTLSDVMAFLKASEVNFEVSDQACPSLEEQLTQAADESRRLEEEKDTLAEEIKKLEEAVDQGTQQRVELEETLERKRVELEGKHEDLEAAESQRSELEKRIQQKDTDLKGIEDELQRTKVELQEERREQAESEQQEKVARRLRWYLGGGIGTALLILAALLLQKSRRRRTELEQATIELQSARTSLERSNATFPDVVLKGDGAAGQEIRVKIIGNALASAENGQVVGRSSGDADYVVAEQSVSRRHALLRVSEGVMTIEDLNSFNGTAINGIKLRPGEARTLASGSRITLGDVEVVAHFVQST